jgi:hypothetical protein
MRRAILTLGLLCASAATAAAQYPTQPYPGPLGGYAPQFNPNNFMPNVFNPRTQPLSPYLNLLRGGDPATEYYYRVRPGTVGMSPQGFGSAGLGGGGGNRPLFFPQLASAPDPLGTGTAGAGGVLPPAGHAVVFGNTMGFFPGSLGQAGTGRAGLAGLGAGRATPPGK